MSRWRRSAWIATVTGALAWGAACGWGGSEGEGRVAQVTVPVGTTLALRLDATVSTTDSEVGDRVDGALLSQVDDVEGRMAVPAGALARWVVTRVDPGDGTRAGVLALALEAIHAGGEWRVVHATVIEARQQPRRATKRDGVPTVILVDDAEATRVLSTVDGPVALDAGARITVRLDEPLVFEARPRAGS